MSKVAQYVRKTVMTTGDGDAMSIYMRSLRDGQDFTHIEIVRELNTLV